MSAGLTNAAVEVYAFDLTIGSNYFECVPLRLHDRRIVSDADDDIWRSSGNPGADSFDERRSPSSATVMGSLYFA